MGTRSKPTVFISFNYKSRDFVDSLDTRLRKDAIVIRYEDGIASWGSFSEFMDTINEQDFAVLVITDAYLKSKACMYEVMRVMKNEAWDKTTMFVVMPDAAVYSEDGRIGYIKFWADKYEALSSKIESLPESATGTLKADLTQLESIRDLIGEFLTKVADTKNPHLWDAIEEICKRVSISPKARFVYSRNDGQVLNIRQALILNVLNEASNLTVRQISERLHLSVNQVSYHLNELVEKGLISCSVEQIRSSRGHLMQVNSYHLNASA